MEKRKERLNKKGFTLVELIIVMAIMAILVGLLAPRLVGYIETSRVSTDINNCDAIRSAVQTALANENAFANATPSSDFVFNGGIPNDTELPGGAFKTELNAIIGTWPSVRARGAANFRVSLDANLNVTVVTVDSAGNVITH